MIAGMTALVNAVQTTCDSTAARQGGALASRLSYRASFTIAIP
jgi:hypothetical protein